MSITINFQTTFKCDQSCHDRVCVLERYACDTTARAQGLLMSNVTVIVRKDCHMSFNSWINSKPQYMEPRTGKQGFFNSFYIKRYSWRIRSHEYHKQLTWTRIELWLYQLEGSSFIRQLLQAKKEKVELNESNHFFITLTLFRCRHWWSGLRFEKSFRKGGCSPTTEVTYLIWCKSYTLNWRRLWKKKKNR